MINTIKSTNLLKQFNALLTKDSFDLDSLKKGSLPDRVSSHLKLYFSLLCLMHSWVLRLALFA